MGEEVMAISSHLLLRSTTIVNLNLNIPSSLAILYLHARQHPSGLASRLHLLPDLHNPTGTALVCFNLVTVTAQVIVLQMVSRAAVVGQPSSSSS
jgi:hypothetical protein